MWKKWWRKERNEIIQNACLLAKARADDQSLKRAGAVKRKQAKANAGPTPDRAATFAKRKKAMGSGFMAKRQMMGMM